MLPIESLPFYNCLVEIDVTKNFREARVLFIYRTDGVWIGGHLQFRVVVAQEKYRCDVRDDDVSDQSRVSFSNRPEAWII
jgi:hypothetical protein